MKFRGLKSRERDGRGEGLGRRFVPLMDGHRTSERTAQNDPNQDIKSKRCSPSERDVGLWMWLVQGFVALGRQRTNDHEMPAALA